MSYLISHILNLVTLKTLVILCNTLKKEGRASRNINWKNIDPSTV